MPRLVTQRESEGGDRAAPAIVGWLSRAAAPTFAVMAVLSAVQESGAAAVLCSVQHTSPLTGMAAMYALMSAFHLPPWLKLIATWWRGASTRSTTARRIEPPISVC